jgi:hypothetical protein
LKQKVSYKPYPTTAQTQRAYEALVNYLHDARTMDDQNRLRYSNDIFAVAAYMKRRINNPITEEKDNSTKEAILDEIEMKLRNFSGWAILNPHPADYLAMLRKEGKI